MADEPDKKTARAPDDVDGDSADAIPKKRTRKGQHFLNPDEVTLHSSDFTFESLRDEHQALFQSFVNEMKTPPVPKSEDDTKGAKGEVPDDGSWEAHYVQNTNQFFPIKNYITKAFPSLLDKPNGVIMECGCGSGSVTLPLMRLLPHTTFVCHDISRTAVELLAAHEGAQEHVKRGQLACFPVNLATEEVPPRVKLMSSSEGDVAQSEVVHGDVDQMLLIFVLGALRRCDMVAALRRLLPWLKPPTANSPGGLLHFRDYGVIDHGHRRFVENKNPCLDGSFVKGDGTTQFFFELEWTKRLFEEAGFATQSLEYHCNRVVNRKNGKRMDKTFVNGVFSPARDLSVPDSTSSNPLQ